MTQNFCDTHILAFLKGWNGAKPLDLSLSHYFRSHKSLGARDRRTIGEAIFSLVRWQSLFDELDPTHSFAKRLHLLQKRPIAEWVQSPDLSEHAQRGLSPFLWEKLVLAYDRKTADAIAETFNSPAPIAIRVNLLKTTREELMRAWEGKFSVAPSSRLETALLFNKREPLFSLPEFKQGLFEMQDEGSQLIAHMVDAKPGDRFLDFCGGSGGKSLAIAPKMQGKGEIILHDIRKSALQEARLRFKRAGVQNGQILPSGHPTLSKLSGKMDWVLADVPCSGTGTLRRNPDMKWKISASMLERLQKEQRSIFEQAISFAKPHNGKIAYATCSLLPEENEQQVEYFLKTHPLVLAQEPLKLLPEKGGCDGFFAAVFVRQK